MQLSGIYIEKEIAKHPRTLKILKKFPKTPKIEIDQFTEIFHHKKQSFRKQKQQTPSLFLAKKRGKFLYEIPPKFSLGANHNYYFSHLLNCPFDCTYCFLQGMFESSSYVFFVNFEDFQTEIKNKVREIKEKEENSSICFFSGYDCDSLALEGLTNFASEFIPFFSKEVSGADIEFRTKSINISSILPIQNKENIIIAFTLAHPWVIKKYEAKTTTLDQRIRAINKLINNGFRVGYRIDPIIYSKNFFTLFSEFLQKITSEIPADKIDSISVGTLRFPQSLFKRIKKQNQDRKLLNAHLEKNGPDFTYNPILKENIQKEVDFMLLNFFSKEKIFWMDR